MDVKYPEDLYLLSEVSKEFLDTMFANDFIVEQKINGVDCVRMTEHYFKEFGEYITNHARVLCLEYWERIIKDTKGKDIMFLIKRICYTHSLIKRVTNGQVDFIEEIGEELHG